MKLEDELSSIEIFTSNIENPVIKQMSISSIELEYNKIHKI